MWKFNKHRAHGFDSLMPDLENEDTIEFRLFRGTLRYSTFMATLQLVDEICNAAISLSDREFERMACIENHP